VEKEVEAGEQRRNGNAHTDIFSLFSFFSHDKQKGLTIETFLSAGHPSIPGTKKGYASSANHCALFLPSPKNSVFAPPRCVALDKTFFSH